MGDPVPSWERMINKKKEKGKNSLKEMSRARMVKKKKGKKKEKILLLLQNPSLSNYDLSTINTTNNFKKIYINLLCK